MYTVHKPKSEKLKKYITEFTILKKEAFKPINYLAFPHSVGSIVFLSGAEIDYKNSKVVIKKSEKNPPSVVALGKYIKPLHLFYENFVDEIGINFSPTGMNYFFDNNYDEIASKPFQFLSNDIWNEFSKNLFNEKERINILENFLLSQVKKKNLKKIEQIIEIQQNNTSIKIKDIALMMGISERTIGRLFNKHVGCTPIEFKKILRFRSSVLMNNEKMNLTELCLNNTYYDSPHFTHEFKQLTSINPKVFFNILTKISDKEFPYIFK